ncbi:hypothetical protein EDD22DRAFT_960719 [Suillus occidentalis]|nr:hypothetical protein EDD22DRAFT_960719 [Suillus occidentalis]
MSHIQKTISNLQLKAQPKLDAAWLAIQVIEKRHGTVWATIVKDPVFQEQNRRSTDLHDCFCNAFPELYQAVSITSPWIVLGLETYIGDNFALA